MGHAFRICIDIHPDPILYCVIMKTFTEEELKKYDGSDPSTPVYIAYEGKVYDVTSHPLFMEGMHFEHYCGCDLSDYMAEAPHSAEVMAEIPVVGEFKK